MSSISAVLFDLDGTLLDTAPDLLYALNILREAKHLPHLSMEAIRPLIGIGSKAMIKQAFQLDEDHPDFKTLRHQFLTYYDEHLARSTIFFPHIETVLNYLDQHCIPWGIVTNKLTHHTHTLLKALKIDHRPACVVCGDTLATHKPDPEPILYACRTLGKTPSDCLYVGDTKIDYLASKAAGTRSLIALYGYRHKNEDPFSWKADGYLENAIELLQFLG